MSQKSRVHRLHDTTVKREADSGLSREIFDMLVENIKRGMSKFGYNLTHEQATVRAYNSVKKKCGFNGFAFDLADVGLEDQCEV